MGGEGAQRSDVGSGAPQRGGAGIRRGDGGTAEGKWDRPVSALRFCAECAQWWRGASRRVASRAAALGEQEKRLEQMKCALYGTRKRRTMRAGEEAGADDVAERDAGSGEDCGVLEKHQRRLAVLARRGELARRVKGLRSAVQRHRNRVLADGIKCETLEVEVAERTRRLEQCGSAIREKRSKMRAEFYSLLHAKDERARVLEEDVLERKRHMIAQLLRFFPVSLPRPFSTPSGKSISPDTHTTIVNLMIPNHVDEWNEVPHEILSTAMGYLVHIVMVIAKYCGIVLPCGMRCKGSESYIWMAGDKRNPRPLFYSGRSPTTEFWSGVEMLCGSIVALCYAQGVGLRSSRTPIRNIYLLTRAPHLACSGPFMFHPTTGQPFPITRASIAVPPHVEQLVLEPERESEQGQNGCAGEGSSERAMPQQESTPVVAAVAGDMDGSSVSLDVTVGRWDPTRTFSNEVGAAQGRVGPATPDLEDWEVLQEVDIRRDSDEGVRQ